MRDPKRIKRILNLIEGYWNQNPDLRLGQMLINLGIADDSVRVWNQQDDATEEYLNNLLKELENK